MLMQSFLQLERARRQMESTAHEQQEMNNELNSQNVAYTAARNQLDSEINLLRVSNRVSGIRLKSRNSCLYR